jgi:hypothetical protein
VEGFQTELSDRRDAAQPGGCRYYGAMTSISNEPDWGTGQRAWPGGIDHGGHEIDAAGLRIARASAQAFESGHAARDLGWIGNDDLQDAVTAARNERKLQLVVTPSGPLPIGIEATSLPSTLDMNRMEPASRA